MIEAIPPKNPETLAPVADKLRPDILFYPAGLDAEKPARYQVEGQTRHILLWTRPRLERLHSCYTNTLDCLAQYLVSLDPLKLPRPRPVKIAA